MKTKQTAHSKKKWLTGALVGDLVGDLLGGRLGFFDC